jgi:ferrous iron transport protein B
MAITKITAMAFLLFNLFSPPCFAAIGAMSAEMKSRKWLFAGIGLQLGMGYTISYIFYTFSTLFISPEALDKGGALIGLAVVVALWVLVCVLIGKNKEEKIKIGITK